MTLHEFLKRLQYRIRGRVVTLKPAGKKRGDVLLSYITLPFLDTSQGMLAGHTNRWECRQMAQAFVDRGYAVDVIDITNTSFTPTKQYDYFIDNGTNMERLTPLVGSTCIKIYHATTAYWEFQNVAENKRLTDLQTRRGVLLAARRQMQPYSLEAADTLSSVCGLFAESTYAFLKKPIQHIPLSTTHTYPSPENKNFKKAAGQYIWFGGAGAVHKGLDLVLEAFAAMPEYNLVVCGKFAEKDFIDLYHKELYETPNIRSIGYLDPGSETFRHLAQESLAIVFPSASEGCASSVVISMHAGLIPVVSHESGIETQGFGITLQQNSIKEIQEAVQKLAQEPPEQTKRRAMSAWRYAREHHTRELFSKAWEVFVDTLES